MFDHDSARSGFAAGDTTITLTNVGNLHRRWVAAFDAAGDGAPILVSNVATSQFASQTMLFQETLAGTTYAINAHTGAIVWKHHTGTEYHDRDAGRRSIRAMDLRAGRRRPRA
jgi:outer membrane protein assembly factor BamB